jgi:hypothetical protein
MVSGLYRYAVGVLGGYLFEAAGNRLRDFFLRELGEGAAGMKALRPNGMLSMIGLLMFRKPTHVKDECFVSPRCRISRIRGGLSIWSLKVLLSDNRFRYIGYIGNRRSLE